MACVHAHSGSLSAPDPIRCAARADKQGLRHRYGLGSPAGRSVGQQGAHSFVVCTIPASHTAPARRLDARNADAQLKAVLLLTHGL
jgi:hypothetical protein